MRTSQCWKGQILLALLIIGAKPQTVPTQNYYLYFFSSPSRVREPEHRVLCKYLTKRESLPHRVQAWDFVEGRRRGENNQTIWPAWKAVASLNYHLPNHCQAWLLSHRQHHKGVSSKMWRCVVNWLYEEIAGFTNSITKNGTGKELRRSPSPDPLLWLKDWGEERKKTRS